MLWTFNPDTVTALRTASATGTLATRQQAEFTALGTRFPVGTRLRVVRVDADNSETLIMDVSLTAALRRRGGIAFFPVATYTTLTIGTVAGDALRLTLVSGSNTATAYSVGVGDGAPALSTARVSEPFVSRTGPVSIGPIVFELSQV